MFDKLKAAAGVAGLLKDLPRIQEKFIQTKEELGRIQCAGHSSCRRVRALMNARVELLSVDVAPKFAAAAANGAGREKGMSPGCGARSARPEGSRLQWRRYR
jgi:hypothetical protein